ncbi:MAG: hypothetical protein IJ415_03960 [Clostridia bacterium]|nr:hypothetical protein [Clostridia bacterium]
MIKDLEQRFEDLKEKFSKEQIVLILAKFEADEILEQVDTAIHLLSKTKDSDEMKKRFISLNNQVKEFVEFIDDLIKEKSIQEI